MGENQDRIFKACGCGNPRVILHRVVYEDDQMSMAAYLGKCPECGFFCTEGDPALEGLEFPGRKSKVRQDNEIVLKSNQRVVDGEIVEIGE
jgi:hypothetical protein